MVSLVKGHSSRNACALIDPSTVSSTFDVDKFAKIRRHQRKERLKVSNVAKFASDTSEESKDIVPQSKENLQTFLWWGTSIKFRDFEVL